MKSVVKKTRLKDLLRLVMEELAVEEGAQGLPVRMGAERGLGGPRPGGRGGRRQAAPLPFSRRGG